jgi:2-polyprenyl-6-methoxyphenol hydroxylase-like FAD-dependent oxidoreductase
MPSGHRALIIGGSIGGLFAGHLLRQAGWDATIFERSAGALADRGAGLGISAELIETMRRIGLRVSRSYVHQVKNSIWLDQRGEIAYESSRLANGSAWSIIYQPLRYAFPAEHYRTAMTLTAIEQDGDGVTAIFADGARERGDLLIAADGVFSTARRQFLPTVEPRSAGYVAWRGLLDEKDLPPAAHRLLLDRAAFSFPEGEQVVSLPVPGPGNDLRLGHRRYYFIWYRPTDREKQGELFTDASGRSHGVSIPPPLIRPQFIAEMKAAARTNLSPVLADIVTRVAQPLLQSIADMEAPQMVFGRVALLGDSAFVARPHVVAGTTKAALDAKGLVDALAASGDDIDAALQRYEHERREFGRAIVGHSRYLGAYLEAQLKPLSARSEAERTRDPKKIMQDYGAPHLVHDVDPTTLDD